MLPWKTVAVFCGCRNVSIYMFLDDKWYKENFSQKILCSLTYGRGEKIKKKGPKFTFLMKEKVGIIHM